MSEEIELGIAGLSDYRVVGSGGFATVYAAWDQGFQRWVAIKVLHSLDEAGRRRFDRERGLMGRLSGHANVITPYQFGYTAANTPYLVMEYVEGGSLEDMILTQGPMPWPLAVDYLAPIADALAYGHAQDVLHRDVKPANILIAGPGFPKLADYGIAAIRESTATQTAFTLAHSPPETFTGGTDARDERSDLYSLASTLYTALAAHTPFHTDGPDSQAAHLTRITHHPVLPLGRERCPDALDAFIRRGLAKEPADRPPTAVAFAQELRAVRHGAPPPSSAGPAPHFAPPGTAPPGSPGSPVSGAAPVGFVAPAARTAPGGPLPATGGAAPAAAAASVPSAIPRSAAPSPGGYTQPVSAPVARPGGPPGSGQPPLQPIQPPPGGSGPGGRTIFFLVLAAAALVLGIGGAGLVAFVLVGDESGAGDQPDEVVELAADVDESPGSTIEEGDGADGSGGEGAGSVPPLTNDGPLVIGGLLPETGVLAFLGPPMQAGVVAAIADINSAGGVFGTDVSWVPGDSGFDATVASETVDRLLGEDATAIVGPASSGVAATVIDQITGAGVIQISPSNTANLFTDYDDDGLYFRTSPSDRLQGAALADLIRADGAETVAFLAIDDPYGSELLEAARDRFEANGGTAVLAQTYDGFAESYDAEVAAVAAVDPDAIVIIGFQETATILDAMVAIGLGPRDKLVYGTDGNMGNALGDQVADPSSLVGMRGTLPGVDVDGRLPDFRQELLVLDPGLVDFSYSAESYDAVTLVALAAVAAGTDDPVAVAARINDVSDGGTVCEDFARCSELLAAGTDIDYDGLSGPLAFTAAGEPGTASVLVLEFDASGGVFVADTLFASAD